MVLEKRQISSGLRRVGMVVFLAILVTLALWPMDNAIGGEKVYESSAVLNLSVPPEFLDAGQREDYIRKEEAQMVSDEVLTPVVAGLNLGEKWALPPNQAVTILRGKTEVKRLASRKGKPRFSITVQASEAELARSVASEVATQYQAQGNAKARREWEEKVRTLNQEIEAQKELVEKKRQLLERARRETGETSAEVSAGRPDNGQG